MDIWSKIYQGSNAFATSYSLNAISFQTMMLLFWWAHPLRNLIKSIRNTSEGKICLALLIPLRLISNRIYLVFFIKTSSSPSSPTIRFFWLIWIPNKPSATLTWSAKMKMKPWLEFISGNSMIQLSSCSAMKTQQSPSTLLETEYLCLKESFPFMASKQKTAIQVF